MVPVLRERAGMMNLETQAEGAEGGHIFFFQFTS